MTIPTTAGTNGKEESGALFKLFADFNITLRSLDQTIKSEHRSQQQRLAALPDSYSASKLSTPGAATTDVQDFGGPPPGREWVLRLLSAVASPLAANAAVVTWYVGQVMPGPAAGQLPATMAKWQFASVPAFQTFTSTVIKVKWGEHLVAGLTGVPASSVIALGFTADDQPAFAQRGVVAAE